MVPTPRKRKFKRFGLTKEDRQRIYSTYLSRQRRREIVRRIEGKTGAARKRTIRTMTNPTRVTSAVRDFARPFPDTIDGIHRMVETIRGFYVPERNKAILLHTYDHQTAHDIFTHRRIPTIFMRARGTEPYPAWGCKSGCEALIAALKAKKAKNVKHVRTVSDTGTPHSLVTFQWGDRTYLADPFPAAHVDLMMEAGEEYPHRVRQMSLIQVGETARAKIRQLREQGQWREGRDSRQLGITFKAFYEKGQ